jgi:hypothetical protein
MLVRFVGVFVKPFSILIAHVQVDGRDGIQAQEHALQPSPGKAALALGICGWVLRLLWVGFGGCFAASLPLRDAAAWVWRRIGRQGSNECCTAVCFELERQLPKHGRQLQQKSDSSAVAGCWQTCCLISVSQISPACCSTWLLPMHLYTCNYAELLLAVHVFVCSTLYNRPGYSQAVYQAPGGTPLALVFGPYLSLPYKEEFC